MLTHQEQTPLRSSLVMHTSEGFSIVVHITEHFYEGEEAGCCVIWEGQEIAYAETREEALCQVREYIGA